MEVGIEAGLKSEHYEITSYGTMCSWAEQMGQNLGIVAAEGKPRGRKRC